MTIVIFFAAYGISSVSRYILSPFIGQWQIFGNAVIYTAILVVSLTYIALPIAIDMALERINVLNDITITIKLKN